MQTCRLVYACQTDQSLKGHQAVSQDLLSADSLMTPDEVAELFRVDVQTVTRWARNGDIASVTLPSGHRRYRRSTIAAILAGEDTEAR